LRVGVRAAGPNGGKTVPGRSQAELQVLEFGAGLQEVFPYLCTFYEVANAVIFISAVFKVVFVNVLTSGVAVLTQTWKVTG